jgi:hypothetical protein
MVQVCLSLNSVLHLFLSLLNNFYSNNYFMFLIYARISSLFVYLHLTMIRLVNGARPCKLNLMLCSKTALGHLFHHRLQRMVFFFFFISKNSLKSAEGRNPSTQEVYKRAPKQRKETNKKVKNQRIAYYPSYARTPKDITF